MSVHETPKDQPPLYCSECGKRLVRSVMARGVRFDPFTGHSMVQGSFENLKCPVQAHDSWYLSDTGKRWVRL